MKIFIRTFALMNFALFLGGCSKDKTVLVKEDFSKKDTITLEPYALKPYSFINLKIEGNVDDTIRISQGADYYDILLWGEIDTLRQIEYYGEGPRTFVIDPYRAKEGKLKISIQL